MNKIRAYTDITGLINIDIDKKSYYLDSTEKGIYKLLNKRTFAPEYIFSAADLDYAMQNDVLLDELNAVANEKKQRRI